MITFVLGRVIFGAYFAYSGFKHFQSKKGMTSYAKSKGIPSPLLAVLLTGAMLVTGGLGFLFNIYLQQSAIILLVFLIPTTFVMHNFWKATDLSQKANEKIAFTKNLALIGALLMML